MMSAMNRVVGLSEYSSRAESVIERLSEYTIINKICGVDTWFRDEHFIRQIAAGLDEFKRVFVLYGGSHGAMEEQALRGLFVDRRCRGQTNTLLRNGLNIGGGPLEREDIYKR